MSTPGNLQLGLHENRIHFWPGETIAGAAQWEQTQAPTVAEVRLCWYTRGKGTEDAAIVEAIPFSTPQPDDMRTFSFTAPAAPYSFSGRLISLIWAVELVLKPGKIFQRVEIVIAPGRREIVLPVLPTD